MELIHGAKGGGGGGHTPTESPDSLLSESTAKILLAISEGEIAGGLDDTRIFLDDTPIGNADGTKNFEGVTWEFRPGSEHQEYIQGIPSVDSETSVGLELKDDQPYVRSINNTQLSAVRIRLSVPQLFQQHDNGDTTGYRIEYAIDLSTDGVGYNEVLRSAFDGKTTSEYQRTHRVDLPKANTGWQIRVRRLTKNQNTARIADKVTISAVTDVIDAKLRYPNTALLFITFNARQFNNRIPKISVRPKGGLLIKVPTNYDPINRTYSGVWDGTFKLAATNNPAWVFYDLILNNRYGCGDRIQSSQVEKWDLYKIAQYCDELVPDGHGGDGKEPRFLCDVYIQSQESAYQVLRDIAAIFRGMTFWADNKVNVVADMPDSIFRTFTNANIVGGKPTYSGGSQQNRYTQALVSYTDTNNHSNDAIEAVADIKLQRRYGVRKTEISAIGCTRQTEANRRGRWALLTNANDRVISFATGLEGAIPSPGHIIAVADSTLAGRDNGGRISRVEGRKITLDRRANIKAGDRLIVNLPNGRSEGRTVSLVADNIITVSTEYSQEPEKNAVWTVDADDLALQLYRVVNITDNGDNTYTITGAIHNPSNYDHIDSGARIDERPITIVPPGVQAPPKNIRISSYSHVNQGISFTTLRVDWDAVENAITYEAQWRRDNNNWVSMPRSSTCGFEVDGIYAGRYQVRVRAINASEISSVWANAQETTLTGKVGNPPKPVNFRASSLVFGIKLDWGFGENTGDTLKTEIQYSKTNDGEGLMLLSDVPYPSKTYEMAGLAAGVVFYFRARLVDKTGNQSEWTDFIRGESEFDTNTMLPELGNHFMTAEAGKQLDEKLNWNTESIAELVNATYELSTDLLVRDGNTQAGIKDLRKVFANQQEAWAQEIKEIYSAVGENKSAIKETQTSITKLDEAIGQRFTAIRTDMDNAQADIISNSQAISNTNKAFAENKTQVQARFDKQEGMIQEKMQATFEQSGDGVVTHSINITIKHNGVSYNAAGQVISAQVKNGKLESFIGYNANNFAWYNPVNGKMELFMYAKNGQFFIKEAFLDKANVREMVLSEAIKSKNYELGKAGFIIDANTGNAEFNNATFRGTIDGADGNFKGTVYAERLIGDVSTSYVIKGSESEGNYGSYQTQVTSSKVIYAGGMPYDVMITIPLVIVMGEATTLSSVKVSIVVDGEKKYLDVANTAEQNTSAHNFTYSHSFSQYSFTIPAGRKNVEIIINGETTGRGRIYVKLFDCLITASKLNSSSFRNS
ncbi:TipJ family phage tail tip protein [Proteus mirabilis]|uniref:TipJ family phage tail tip protein n=1 Tax=Proteus mirabilis TaxID=584 RepID=UPI0023492E93|nr:phage tail protein [Proteus mirabilis]MDC5888581.1 phage tail protein [Proteus mirabilis]MDC5906178.1 phage tail protein [Proteus mirabilis]MDC5909719.1 phage tail protein [Proteus mirabilis]MDC5923830.1 phage tail protein [Proteus mirabilis]MDC5934359.1 phage tail protein [Proteus mirabilis]